MIKQDNTSSVYFPAGTWYVFNGATDAAGKSVYSGATTRITLKFHDEIPMYVLAGGVIPVAPVVQYSDALPGGALDAGY